MILTLRRSNSGLGTLPWIFVPAMLVPIDFLVHVVIMVKLRSAKPAIGTMAIEVRNERGHQHEPHGLLNGPPFAGIQRPEALCKSRFVGAGSARNLAGVFQKTALFSAAAANFKSVATTSSATSASKGFSKAR
jgi:hypothetical protein